MPKLNDDLEQFNLPTGHYGFSGTRLGDLGACEFTICQIVVDISGSVEHFSKEMEKCLKDVIQSCQYSPRADNLMVRLTTFNSSMQEVHGFKLLSTINLDDYSNVLRCGGMTALFDATENAVQALNSYGKQLSANDFSVNGLVVVITDGDDNASKATKNLVKAAFTEAVKGENLESLMSILVGVNISDPMISNYLNQFKTEAGFMQYVEIDNANAKSLAKLADFVSKSISAQSQSLGTGGPSKSLSF